MYSNHLHFGVYSSASGRKPILICRAANGTNEVAIYNALDFSDISSLRGHNAQIWCLRVEGSKIFTGSEDRTMRIWDIESGRLLHTTRQHTRGVNTINCVGTRVITGSYDRTAISWNIETGKPEYTLRGHTGSIDCVFTTRNKVVTGSDDETAIIWDLETGVMQHKLVGHSGPINDITASGNRVATSSDDFTCRVWDLNSGDIIHCLDGWRYWMWCVSIKDDKVLSTCSGGKIRVWDINTGERLWKKQCAPKIPIYSVATYGSDWYTHCVGNNETVRWKIKSKKLVKKEVFNGTLLSYKNVLVFVNETRVYRIIDLETSDMKKMVKLSNLVDTSTLIDLASYILTN